MDDRQKIIIRRGPSCCGCGCAIPTFVIPLVSALLWVPLGAALALAAAIPAGIVAVHAAVAVDRRLHR